MALQPHSEPEFTVVSTTNNTGSAPYSGAFFPGAAGFTIGGGVFTSNVTNNVYNPPQEQSAAFRTIRLGDINLLKEIRMNNESGVVGRQSQRTNARRMYYSAKVVGAESGLMTVAMYQEDDTEEVSAQKNSPQFAGRLLQQWRQLIERYESIRHPKIMQLYGLVSTKGLRGMVFHDELIPFDQFLSRFRHSHILTTYIKGYSNSERLEAMDYCQSHSLLQNIGPSVWIRPATGEVCVDLVRGQGHTTVFRRLVRTGVQRIENLSLDDPRAEVVAISTLKAHIYHSLCSWPFVGKLRFIDVPTRLSIGPHTIIVRSNVQRGTWSKITEPLGFDRLGHWAITEEEHKGEILANSWMRFDSRRARKLFLLVRSRSFPEPWMAQANHIFTQIHSTSHLEDYVCVTEITFTLRSLPNTYNTQEPEGYLFVCPPENFRTGRDSFQWPNCPAYWSLDPSGAARLSTDDAQILGFPIIHIDTIAYGSSWDNRVYDGLRRFHRGRGFDPDTQEAAIHCRYPLYKVLSRPIGLC